MNNLRIEPYRDADNAAALELENRCPQGDSLEMRFVRTSFSRRSEVYDRYRLLCAREGDHLIGIAGAARKKVHLHGRDIVAAYGYDVRIDPDYRKHGTGLRLSRELMNGVGDRDCTYTYISGENSRALGLLRFGFGPKVIIPLTYVIIPVYKYRRDSGRYGEVSGETLHKQYLLANPDMEFTPEYSPPRMLGHVTSFSDGGSSGCSIWTNRELLAETITRLPCGLSMARKVFSLMARVMNVPSIPAPGELIDSYFLYDLYARSDGELKSLLRQVGNHAFAGGQKFLYALLPNNSPVLAMMKRSHIMHFSMPYLFLAGGKIYPHPEDQIYVDIRDL